MVQNSNVYSAKVELESRETRSPLVSSRGSSNWPWKEKELALHRTVRRTISLNLRKFLRKIAGEVDVSPLTLRRTMHQYLGLKSYVLHVKQPLTEYMRKKRMAIGRHLLNSMGKR